MRQMIEKVSYMPAIELFARQKVDGWDCWGNVVLIDDVLSQGHKVIKKIPKKLFDR